MKRLSIIAIILLATANAWGQQEPLLTNYQLNYFTWNPAAAGSAGQWALRAHIRGEWVRFPGAPITQTVSLHGALGRVGLGATLVNDLVGPEQRTGVQTGYAYLIPVGDNTLSIGLGLNFIRYQLRQSEVRTLVGNDPSVLALNGDMIIDMNFGIFYYGDKFYAGVSAPRLLQLTKNEISDAIHYGVVAGYKMRSNENFTFEPSMMIKGAAGAPLQYEIDAKAHLLNEQLYLGVGYRGGKGNFISALIGAKLLGKYHFAYSYDFTTGEFQNYSWGSHEVMLGMDFDWKRKAAEE